MLDANAVRRSFVAGLILITPLVVTVYVLRVLVNWSFIVINPVVQGTRLTQYTANIEVVAQLLAVALILGGVTLLGYAAQRSAGRRLFGNVGRIVNFVPLVNVIYASVRQVASSLVERRTAYDGVALVEYPRPGVYAIGLVTGAGPAEFESSVGQPVYNVFLPNSPNPTAGRLVHLPADQIHEVDMTVRRGLRLLVTSGMGADDAPPSAPKVEGAPE
jgi:uncharacterized membrane protein